MVQIWVVFGDANTHRASTIRVLTGVSRLDCSRGMRSAEARPITRGGRNGG
jgi:hypothetical protein